MTKTKEDEDELMTKGQCSSSGGISYLLKGRVEVGGVAIWVA